MTLSQTAQDCVIRFNLINHPPRSHAGTRRAEAASKRRGFALQAVQICREPAKRNVIGQLCINRTLQTLIELQLAKQHRVEADGAEKKWQEVEEQMQDAGPASCKMLFWFSRIVVVPALVLVCAAIMLPKWSMLFSHQPSHPADESQLNQGDIATATTPTPATRGMSSLMSPLIHQTS